MNDFEYDRLLRQGAKACPRCLRLVVPRQEKGGLAYACPCGHLWYAGKKKKRG